MTLFDVLYSGYPGLSAVHQHSNLTNPTHRPCPVRQLKNFVPRILLTYLLGNGPEQTRPVFRHLLPMQTDGFQVVIHQFLCRSLIILDASATVHASAA